MLCLSHYSRRAHPERSSQAPLLGIQLGSITLPGLFKPLLEVPALFHTHAQGSAQRQAYTKEDGAEHDKEVCGLELVLLLQCWVKYLREVKQGAMVWWRRKHSLAALAAEC